jgi:hypothetical protein
MLASEFQNSTDCCRVGGKPAGDGIRVEEKPRELNSVSISLLRDTEVPASFRTLTQKGDMDPHRMASNVNT